MTTRHLVLDPISAPNSLVPTFVTIRQLVLSQTFNSVLIRHLVVNPRLSSVIPIIAPISVNFVLFTSLLPNINRQLTRRQPPDIEMIPPSVGLDCS